MQAVNKTPRDGNLFLTNARGMSRIGSRTNAVVIDAPGTVSVNTTTI
jgi:hypothetical protein